MTLPNSLHFRLADRAVGGDLEKYLREARSPGRRRPVSFRAIAEELNALGVPVTHESVRTWCKSLGIDGAKKAS